MNCIRVLALDLEGTLISNAVSQIPRPGLRVFLENCALISERVVSFTAVREDKFREIAAQLVADGTAPSWYQGIDYVQWNWKTKDLQFVQGYQKTQILLVDDNRDYVHPGQESQWVEVQTFESPYPETDAELSRVLQVIRQRIEGQS